MYLSFSLVNKGEKHCSKCPWSIGIFSSIGTASNSRWLRMEINWRSVCCPRHMTRTSSAGCRRARSLAFFFSLFLSFSYDISCFTKFFELSSKGRILCLNLERKILLFQWLGAGNLNACSCDVLWIIQSASGHLRQKESAFAEYVQNGEFGKLAFWKNSQWSCEIAMLSKKVKSQDSCLSKVKINLREWWK